MTDQPRRRELHDDDPDRTGEEVARFNLDRCWPSKLSVSDLQAGSDEVMVEEVTIQHELFTWVKK